MAIIKCNWVKTEYPIRISEYANELGFNLRTIDFNGIAEELWNMIDGKIRNQIMFGLDELWEYKAESQRVLADVTQGVYVITLSDNLTIDYNGNPSKVIYIGRGKTRLRIYNHLKYWIRYLSDSLQDIALDIWMTEIRINGNKNAYKEVETDLLNHFWDKFECFPLQNKKRGDTHEKFHDYSERWNLPLRNPTNIQNGWSIKPLKNNPWAIEFEDV